MATTLGFKQLIDKPMWRPLAPSLNANATAGSLACDLRNTDFDPHIYQFVSAAIFNIYNPYNDEHLFIGTPAMGTFAAGANCIFVPSAGPNGTLAAGATTTSVVLSTALPAAVGINQLANRGDGLLGFKIRIMGNTAGGSGTTEEKYIIGNTAGTTPTIYLDSALTFTPAAGDRYEIISGRVFIMSTAAAIFKYYDVACNVFSAALTVTNLTTPATDNAMVILDEQYVPSGQVPGGGFFGVLTATATGAASITGTIGGADASQALNEWTNFQIRIVNDPGTPLAVGQRRKIISHTAANPTVYTVAAWATTPSATAQYVVEGIGDLICITGASVATHSYPAGGFRADGAWNTAAVLGAASVQFANHAANTAAGTCLEWNFGTTALDAGKSARYSHVFNIRGGGVNTIDILDIAANAWTNAIAYGHQGSLVFNAGTCSTHNPVTNDGRYMYLCQSGLSRFYRFDMKDRVMEAWCYLPFTQGAVLVGTKLAFKLFVDGATKLGHLYHWQNTGSNLFECAMIR